jgi:BirA family transcriptional regulator, biotin operon repressor / biotin---[acetyl-CoA-carboxylase] ligase
MAGLSTPGRFCHKEPHRLAGHDDPPVFLWICGPIRRPPALPPLWFRQNGKKQQFRLFWELSQYTLRVDEKTFRKALEDLKLGELRYLASTGSTNDLALAWATEGAPDLSVIFADEQTTGRGRKGRKWHTPAGAALAVSLVLRPDEDEKLHVAHFSGLGALAVCDALEKAGLEPQIKWPNDVLANRRKVAGVLAEAVWTGEDVDSIIVGIGVNVLQAAVPPEDEALFPATSVEAEGGSTDRAQLLHDVLAALLALRPRLGTTDFLAAWDAALAFQGETVRVWRDEGESLAGTLSGLEADGSLTLVLADGATQSVKFGEVHLRPDGPNGSKNSV